MPETVRQAGVVPARARQDLAGSLGILERRGHASALETSVLSARLGRVHPYPARRRLDVGPSGSLVLVVDGCVARQRYLLDGTRRILSLAFAGDLILAPRAPDALWALAPSRVSSIPARELKAAGVDAVLARSVEGEASLVRAWLANATMAAPRRVAHVMCEIMVRAPRRPHEPGWPTGWRITQGDLADMTHMSHVHVNRALRSLEAEGMLRCARRSIVIPDPARLARYCGFAPGYIPGHADDEGLGMAPPGIERGPGAKP